MTAAAGADAVARVAAPVSVSVAGVVAASGLPAAAKTSAWTCAAAVSVAAAAELVHLVGDGGVLAVEEGPSDVGVDGVQREGVFVLVDVV